jgi:hypothetical protein
VDDAARGVGHGRRMGKGLEDFDEDRPCTGGGVPVGHVVRRDLLRSTRHVERPPDVTSDRDPGPEVGTTAGRLRAVPRHPRIRPARSRSSLP